MAGGTFGGIGCGPALQYHLQPLGTGATLVPPSRSDHPQQIQVGLVHDSACSRLSGGFADSRFGFLWRLDRSKLQLVLDPSLGRFTGNLPIPLLDGIQGLRDNLDRAVAAGCLPEEKRSQLLRRVTESIAIAPDLAQTVVLGPYATQRYVDLRGNMQLTLSYALQANQPGRYDLGYVSRQYRLADTTPDGRGVLRLTSVQIHHAAVVPAEAPPPPMTLPLAQPPQFFRLFFYLRRSDADHDVALLNAASLVALEAATHALLSRPGICAKLAVAGAACRLAPPDVGMDAEVTVEVQGRRVAVPLPATVDQAMLAAGGPRAGGVLATLTVWRPYHGRLIPVVPTDRWLLPNFVLSGGERIRWRVPLPTAGGASHPVRPAERAKPE